MRRYIRSSVRRWMAGARRGPSIVLLSFGVATTAMSAITPDGGRGHDTSSPRVAKSDAETLLAQASSAFSIDDVRGRAGEPIALKIILPRQLDASFAYLMFRGLPDGFLLSAGARKVDSWLVPIAAVQGLSLTAPASSSGVSQLDVLLVRTQRGAAERDSMFVRIEPTAAANPVATVNATPATPPPAQSAPDVASAFADTREPDAGARSNPAPAVSAQVTASDQAMLDRGHALLASGDVAAARLIYGRLAKKGLAVAAVSMAQTYDADYLKSLKVTGLRPDVELAREWYGKAAELGDVASAKRLETLVGAAPN